MKSRYMIGIVAIALVLMLALVGCSSKGEIDLGDGNANYEGKSLTVALPANSTTGYEWLYLIDGTTIAPDGAEYVADDANGKVGVGGTQTFKFTAIAEGESTIYFTYARSWEDNEPVYSYSITVKTDKSNNIKEITGDTDAVAPTVLP